MKIIFLTSAEMEALLLQDPLSEDDGGYQGLLVHLQKNLNRRDRSIELTDDDLERIPRYAFDYKQGGWQDRLVGIFGRTLGPNLGR